MLRESEITWESEMKAIALVTMFFFSGCSFFSVRGPGSTVVEMQECTETNATPMFDAIIAGIFTTLSIGCFADFAFDPPEEGAVIIGYLGTLLAVPAILYSLSSYTGFKNTSKCRQAKKKWEQSKDQKQTSQMIDQAIHSSF